MLSRTLCHPSGQPYCQTRFNAADGWLETTWQGFVTEVDGERGALAALEVLALSHVPLLLNDNSQIQGPWFDSLDWLRRVWAPQAQHLGLRYLAHVVQPHTEADLSAYLTHNLFEGLFELQFFTHADEARDWLRACQQAVSRMAA